MVNFMYNTGAAEVALLQLIDLIADPIKGILVASGYVANKDDDVVDAGGANDAVDHELNGTGYTGGWGGSGRVALTSKTIEVDKTNDRQEFHCAPIVYPSIDAGTPARICVIKEGVANDTTSRLIGQADSGFPKTTNGADLTINPDAEGLFQIAT